ncbi:DUF4232 domain-containing protein [Streptomyces sp. NPDC053542]|uniref:DUF4232 domain-containing protein n=1 Tax=Streptomyces sp. NPDC053542 TaxID=3365710 RepID=UPI0037D41B00
MSHRTRRHGRKAAAAALLAATALALTACQSGEPGAAGADSSASADSSAGAAGAAEDSGTHASSGGQQATGSGGASGTESSAGTDSASGTDSPAGTGNSAARCTTADLTAGWGSAGGGRPDMTSSDQQTATVWFKNKGGGACTISGFPGVQLKGADGTTWDLRRSGKKPVAVVLKPGADTHFTFQLLPSTRDDDRKVEPATVVVTPPDEKRHFALKWPYGGAVLDQSGATHPGTFVNPVGAS